MTLCSISLFSKSCRERAAERRKVPTEIEPEGVRLPSPDALLTLLGDAVLNVGLDAERVGLSLSTEMDSSGDLGKASAE